MRYVAHRTTDWRILETVSNGRAPSDVWSDANDDELAHIYGQLSLLRAAGCPPNREHAAPRIQQWKKYKGWNAPLTIYVLKTTPFQWRLYFFVVPPATKREIEIIYAVAKKEDRRNPADFKACCRVLDRIVAGTADCRHVQIPLPR